MGEKKRPNRKWSAEFCSFSDDLATENERKRGKEKDAVVEGYAKSHTRYHSHSLTPALALYLIYSTNSISHFFLSLSRQRHEKKSIYRVFLLKASCSGYQNVLTENSCVIHANAQMRRNDTLACECI